MLKWNIFHDIWWLLMIFHDKNWRGCGLGSMSRSSPALSRFLIWANQTQSTSFIMINHDISRLIMTNHHPIGRGLSTYFSLVGGQILGGTQWQRTIDVVKRVYTIRWYNYFSVWPTPWISPCCLCRLIRTSAVWKKTKIKNSVFLARQKKKEKICHFFTLSGTFSLCRRTLLTKHYTADALTYVCSILFGHIYIGIHDNRY